MVNSNRGLSVRPSVGPFPIALPITWSVEDCHPNLPYLAPTDDNDSCQSLEVTDSRNRESERRGGTPSPIHDLGVGYSPVSA
jgi:hypothetical protein